MYSHQLYPLYRPAKPEADENLFQRRKVHRPSSAKATQQPALKKRTRPSSATRGQDPSNLNRVPSHYEPDPVMLARLKPRSIAMEKERLYEDTLTLKMELNLTKEENIKLRTRIQQMDKERIRREEMLEDSKNRDNYYGKGIQSQHLIGSLKLAIKDLKTELAGKEEELSVLRKNLKSTKVAEIEIEVQAYIDECTRLKHHLEEVMTSGINPAVATYEQRIRDDEEQLELYARENEELREALRTAQAEVQKWRERMVSVKKKPKKKAEAQHLKSEVQKLRAQLEAKEKKAAQIHTSEITPKRKDSPKQSKAVQIANPSLKPEPAVLPDRSPEKARDLHNLPEPAKSAKIPESKPTGKHPDLVIEGFFGKISKMLLDRKLSLAILLAYIYRSETGFCSSAELYTGLQTQGMAVEREEVEIVARTLGEDGRLSLAQFQAAYKRFESSKNSFSGYEESSRGTSSRVNESSARAQAPATAPQVVIPQRELTPVKQKEAPSPVPVQVQTDVPKVTLQLATPLLRHISYRLQLQRQPKTKLFQAVFGAPFEKDSIVTLGEMCGYLAKPPISFTEQQEGLRLARFLLEPAGPPPTIKEAEIKELRAPAKDIISRLSSNLEEWSVFSTDDESRFDREIAQALQRNKLAIKESCKSFDLGKTGFITLQELQAIVRNLELKFSDDTIHYMTLLFYSHNMELDKVPYKEFIKAYTQSGEDNRSKRTESEPVEMEGKEESSAREEGGEEEEEEGAEGVEGEEEEEGEEGEELNEDERAQIVRFYLEQIAAFLNSKKMLPEDLFEAEDGYIYPESLVQGLRHLPNVHLEKRDIVVFLEGLQDEEMDELCISLDYLEQLLEHYGVTRSKANPPRPSSAQNIINRSLDSVGTHEKRVSMLESDQ